ncbi:hypothetical protein EWM64_g684 [Hericium alpestre]|uniref:HTH APSES-type domain-containing protein n=1 Tax=Hericium alpestre TaxID=135208 RepID=A0A4Z0ACD9_9AGAM|nr:hypothetical protein EWM64_g684 [Hericium alpestre]
MTSGLLQNTLPSPTTDAGSASGPRFRPYASPNHHVTKSRYITSNDPRGYIPVYEYPLNGQWIMMDVDDGYVLWTGIWKALGNSKADIVKMIESQPDLASQIRRVRGGYLKIQGTWMPYEVALRLSRRVAWPIRHDLVPLFGPTFPSTCLMPDQPGYGQVVNNGNGRRRARRSNAQNPSLIGGESSSAPQAGWTIISSVPQQDTSGQSGPPVSLMVPSSFPPTAWASQQVPITGYRQSVDPSMASFSASPTDGGADRLSVVREQSQRSRFSPYPGPPSSASYAPSFVSGKSSPISMHYMPPEPSASSEAERRQAHGERVTLPPIQLPSENSVAGRSQFSLPPISTLAGAASTSSNDSRDVLKRLQADDSSDEFRPPSEGRWHHRRSPSASPDGQ